MSATEQAKWRRMIAGQQEAARVADQTRAPVAPDASFRRLLGLRRLAEDHGSIRSSSAAEENLLFHLEWRDLRNRIRP